MGKVTVLVLFFSICGIVGGCSREETYKGKPLSEWIQLSLDSDYSTRHDAIEALNNMKSPKAKNIIYEYYCTEKDAEKWWLYSLIWQDDRINEGELFQNLNNLLTNKNVTESRENLKKTGVSNAIIRLSTSKEYAPKIKDILMKMKDSSDKDDPYHIEFYMKCIDDAASFRER